MIEQVQPSAHGQHWESMHLGWLLSAGLGQTQTTQ